MKTKRATSPGNTRIVWAWRALLLAIPVVLAGGAWKVHQLQEPILVGYVEDIQSHVLFERMAKEAREHPFATTISVYHSDPWPQDGGFAPPYCESLDLNRRDGTLEYGMGDSGWTYGHVEISGLELLAQSRLSRYPTHLSTSLDAKLRQRGWTP